MPTSQHEPATWRTWLLASADELRPEDPANSTADELAELVYMQGDRDEAMIVLIQKWNNRPAVLPWTDMANAAFAEFKLPPVRQARAQCILQTAMSDAFLAAYDAQEAYDAPLPATLDAAITPLERIVADRPAFPSAQAAVAGAAATVLTALLPDAARNHFTGLAYESALTRLQAGLNVKRDIEAGLALGNVIGLRALAYGVEDQPASAWEGSGRLEGDGYWQPPPPAFVTLPLEPLAGTWAPSTMTPTSVPTWSASGFATATSRHLVTERTTVAADARQCDDAGAGPGSRKVARDTSPTGPWTSLPNPLPCSPRS